MVFSSFVFLLAFLPVILILYYVIPRRFRNIVLLAGSLLFYAWGEPIYVLIMVFSTFFDYSNGRLIEFFKNKKSLGLAKLILVIDIIGNLGILGFFKYSDFFLGTIKAISGANIELLGIALPIGISFYTFQTMSYTIDVYRGQVPAQKNLLHFATYVCLFPQLIAGPIVKYRTIAEELENRQETIKDFSAGAYRFTIGLAKKVILANQAGALFESIKSLSSISACSAWLGAIAYTMQIYFDFSGYSDMAIGLGRMFGFHFEENFKHPYESSSITEFWRRWHISLGSWFREYVYIPLGGNRFGMSRQVVNIAVVWLLTGLWHGASWNFVLWGVYYGILLMIEKLVLLDLMESWPKVLRHLYTMIIVIVGWVIFAFTDFGELGVYLSHMFANFTNMGDSSFLFYVKDYLILLILMILSCINWKGHFRWLRLKGWMRMIIMIVLLIVSIAFLVGDTYNPFLYFRF